jgi:peptidoglycan/LPS O-acetylase OafA/YrhL
MSIIGRGTTVEKAYLVLLDTMILVYFIPYCYMFLTFLAAGLGKRGLAGTAGPAPRPLRTLLVGVSGLAVTVFAMVVATIPPPGTTEPWLFELKVLGGASIFVAAGGLLYRHGLRARRLATAAPVRTAPDAP